MDVEFLLVIVLPQMAKILKWQKRVHIYSLESVHFLFAVLMCAIVFLFRFVISTVIQLSGVHSSHIYLAVLFPHIVTDIVMHSRPCFCRLGTRTFI